MRRMGCLRGRQCRTPEYSTLTGRARRRPAQAHSGRRLAGGPREVTPWTPRPLLSWAGSACGAWRAASGGGPRRLADDGCARRGAPSRLEEVCNNEERAVRRFVRSHGEGWKDGFHRAADRRCPRRWQGGRGPQAAGATERSRPNNGGGLRRACRATVDGACAQTAGGRPRRGPVPGVSPRGPYAERPRPPSLLEAPSPQPGQPSGLHGWHRGSLPGAATAADDASIIMHQRPTRRWPSLHRRADPMGEGARGSGAPRRQGAKVATKTATTNTPPQ